MISEGQARLIVRQRSNGACEICDAAKATDYQHRVNRSQGGQYDPAAALDLCHLCHMDVHANPAFATARGWMVPGSADPAQTPALLRTWFGQWWVMLTSWGGYEMLDRPVSQLL